MATPLPYNYPNLAYLEHPDLPRLPIPPLEETLAKYLKTVQVLLTPAEFEETKKAVEEFRQKDAPVLHQKLVELAKEAPTSWLEGWWDSMYLEIRDPNPIWTNPCFLLEDDAHCTTLSSRAASLIVSSLQFYQKIARKTLEPDFERKTPLCMSQYGRLFATSRIPGVKRDRMETSYNVRHIVAMAKGQIYWFDVLDSEGNILRENEIENTIKRILREADKTIEQYPPLGLFTTEDRDVWAKIYTNLSQDRQNAESLQIISQALFVVCLDDVIPSSMDEYSAHMLHADGKNRWFDKCFQFIVLPNGKAGINMEHSGYDGHTMIRHIRELCANAKSRKKEGYNDYSKVLLQSNPKKLSWNLSPEIKQAVMEADKKFQAFTATTQTVLLQFKDFGKNVVTKYKISPDAFVQLCFQVAYYKMFGKVDSTYESGMTKQFYHGRTETVRPITADSVAFCKAFASKEVSDEEKESLFRRAADTHVRTANDAKNGRGVDRHLYGMQWLAKYRIQMIHNYQMPRIYTDKAYPKMKTDLMSTSSLVEPALQLFGFGPTATEGFGLGYSIRDDFITINITSYIGQARTYSRLLEQSFKEVRDLLEANHQKKLKATGAGTSQPPRSKL